MNTYLDLEKTLSRTLRPTPLSDAYIQRLETTFASPLELEEAVFNRFLGAMNAEQSNQDQRFEEKLRILKPASVPTAFKNKVRHSVETELQSRVAWYRVIPSRQVFLGFLSGVVAACVAFVLVTPEPVNSDPILTAGLRDTSMERSALEISPNQIEWDASGMIPCQSFEVTYQDTFSVHDSNGSQLQVQVPAKHQVSIPLELY